MTGEHPYSRSILRTVMEATGLSRRKAFAAIREGRVQANGVPVTDPSAAHLGQAFWLDGRALGEGVADKVYLMLNKPPAVISATTDPRGRTTVVDLVPVEWRVPGLHAVGRLDLDTTGLLILTNDGDLTYRLTHPSHEVEKEYWLTSRPELTERALRWLREGVELDGELRVPGDIRRLPPESGYDVAIVIKEGRKRQVRRMIEAVGARVLALRRVREGGLWLGSLAEGSTRQLTALEVSQLLTPGGGSAVRGRQATPERSWSGRVRPGR